MEGVCLTTVILAPGACGRGVRAAADGDVSGRSAGSGESAGVFQNRRFCCEGRHFWPWAALSRDVFLTLFRQPRANRLLLKQFSVGGRPEAAPLPNPCLKITKKFGKSSKFLRRCHFSKLWPAGGSTPAKSVLENHKRSLENYQTSQGDVIFQNSGPPEAAPLLDPYLKGTKKFTKIDKIPKEVSFVKTLTRRRQHPC